MWHASESTNEEPLEVRRTFLFGAPWLGQNRLPWCVSDRSQPPQGSGKLANYLWYRDADADGFREPRSGLRRPPATGNAPRFRSSHGCQCGGEHLHPTLSSEMLPVPARALGRQIRTLNAKSLFRLRSTVRDHSPRSSRTAPARLPSGVVLSWSPESRSCSLFWNAEGAALFAGNEGNHSAHGSVVWGSSLDLNSDARGSLGVDSGSFSRAEARSLPVRACLFSWSMEGFSREIAELSGRVLRICNNGEPEQTIAGDSKGLSREKNPPLELPKPLLIASSSQNPSL
ncbi:hypothetical protein VNO77_03366 [Canavalia gladiata]|uniref:Uncharacterized protein n=1 Tax=Canavalia gladiata TaxID=3824 RepID=A0AAN9MWL6_CANGL